MSMDEISMKYCISTLNKSSAEATQQISGVVEYGHIFARV